jgi:hypothetical protein
MNPSATPENYTTLTDVTEAVLGVMEGHTLDETGEHFIRPGGRALIAQGLMLPTCLSGNLWSQYACKFQGVTDEVSESCDPSPAGRYFRQASSRCKAAVWESRSPKISLASSTPRN